jgi:ABC-type transporter Mla MlaB component
MGRASRTITFAISGALTRSEVPRLAERACSALAASGAALVVCDVSSADCDAVTVDALARLKLAATRRGCRLRLDGACPALVGLVGLMGLTEVLPER